MATEVRLGAKVRALRRRQKLTQVELADRLGISPSYLDLIEHNRRALTAPLLIKLASLFDLDLKTFAADDDERLASDLMEVFADTLFEEHHLTTLHRYRGVRTVHAVGLGCRIDQAAAMVYADGLDLKAKGVPVGITCRMCERMDCEQRAVPPLQAPLEVDENVRGLSFYAPATTD